MSKKTHFGYQQIEESTKSAKITEVFHAVATKYDLMNDIMSMGIHRFWKQFTFSSAMVRPGNKVLDIAGGTGDLAIGWSKKVGNTGEVWLTDINFSMLSIGRNRMLNKGIIVPVVVCDAEQLPFPDNYFDIVSVAFGLRNMTHKDIALQEIHRVLMPGGQLLVLEFSKIYEPLTRLYDFYSFNVLPKFGQLIAKNKDSYQYLVESIRMHPNQETFKQMILDAGFDQVDYHNLTAGIVALHKGYKY